MSREWKPGDVAAISYLEGDEDVYLRVTSSSCGNKFHGSADHWHLTDGSGLWASSDGDQIRPLLVVDPEDREQVERLVGQFRSLSGWASSLGRESSNAMQDALRSLIAPPKPDEPTGLGAVVEDASGDRWIRVGDEDGLSRSWAEFGNVATIRDWCRWSDLSAVRILSEGVVTDA